jgi:hypothetical protein
MLLFSCTAPLTEPSPTDTPLPTTQDTLEPESITEAPTSETTDTSESESETVDENVANPYPDTVYMFLSSEDIDSYMQSLGRDLPFNLVSGHFISKNIEYSQIILEDQSDKTFSLSGTIHSLRYCYSMIPSTEHYASYDVYMDGETRYSVYKDGSIHSYTCPSLHKGSSQTPISDEKAKEIAAEFVAAYFPNHDFDDYTVSILKLTGDVTSSHATIVKYIKRTHGYFLGDKLQIDINSDGIITCISAEKLGCSAAYSYLTEKQIEIAREQLLNSIIESARTPVGSENIMIGSDGNLYMYMNGKGWTFNDRGMIDENSKEVTEIYYVRLNP